MAASKKELIGKQREEQEHRDFYSTTPATNFLSSFAAKLVDECLPNIGDHGNVDDRVEHPIEEGEGQGPVEPLGGHQRGGDGGLEEDQAVGSNCQKEEPGQEDHLDCYPFHRAAKV